MKAMIFAAGLGTRLKPFTEKHPKALALVNGKTLLERNIEYLKAFGFTEFVINIHHFPDQIQNFLKQNKDFGCKIELSDETNMLLETGGGLKKAAEFLKGSNPFLVMNADILTNLNIHHLLSFHASSKALATLAVTDRVSSRYFLFNTNHELCGWKNTKTGEEKICRDDKALNPKAFSGIHVLSPLIFDLMRQEGKFSIVDVYLDLCREHLIKSYDHSSDILIDVGKPEAIKTAETFFK